MSAAWSPTALAQARQPVMATPATLRFAVMGGLDGRFADPNCRQNTRDSVPFARLAGDLARARAEAGGDDALPLLAIGDIVGTGALGRHLLSEAGPQPRGLAKAIAALKPALIGIGDGEFEVPPEALGRYLEALRTEGLRVGAVNLACGATRAQVCQGGAANSRRILQVSGVKVGVFTLQYADLEQRVDPAHLAGLSFAGPGAAVDRAIADLRKDGAELLVAVVHRGGHGAPEAEVLQVADVLRGDVHLIITDAVTQESNTPWQARVGSGAEATAVVALPGSERSWTSLEVTLAPGPTVRDVQIAVHLPDAATPVDAGANQWLTQARSAYCARWSRPVGALRLDTPLDLEAFAAMVLQIMRGRADAEVAVINRGAFEARQAFPLRGSVTRDDLHRIFRFRNSLVRFNVSGEVLQSWIEGDPGIEGGKRDLLFAGVEVQGDEVRVNGRALIPSHRYAVASIDYLARGGDGTLPGVDAFEPVGAQGERLVRDHVQAWLEARGDSPLKTREGLFRDLWRLPLWLASLDLRADVASSSADNRPGYHDARLTGLDALTLSVHADARLRMNTRDHGWRNRLLVNYARTTTPDLSSEPPVDLALVLWDRVSMESAWAFRWLRDTALDRSWWAPLPRLDARLRSQISVPEEQRGRLADLDLLAGLAWELGGHVELHVGAGLNRELLRVDPQPYFRPLLAVGATLDEFAVLTLGDSDLNVGLELDYRLKGPGDDHREEFHLNGRASFSLVGPLSLYAAADLFALRMRGPTQDLTHPAHADEFARQVRLDFGLRVLLEGAVQSR